MAVTIKLKTFNASLQDQVKDYMGKLLQKYNTSQKLDIVQIIDDIVRQYEKAYRLYAIQDNVVSLIRDAIDAWAVTASVTIESIDE